MVNASAVQAKIDSVVTRPDLSRTILIEEYTVADNEYGEPDEIFVQQITTTGIVLDYVETANKFDKAGLFKDSSFVLLIQHDVVVEEAGKKYYISFGGKEFNINRVSKPQLGELTVHQRVFVSEKVEQ